MPERKLLQMGLSLLEAIGLNPMTQNRFGKLKMCVGSFLLVVHFVFLLIESGSKWNGVETFHITGEFLVSHYQSLSKLLVVIINRDKFKELVVKTACFKNVQALSRTLKMELVSIHEKMEIVVKTYLFICILYVLLMLSTPVLLNLRVFPMPMYNFVDLTESPQYQMIYALEIVEFIFISALVLGSDVLFLSFVFYIYCEMKIVANDLEFLAEDKGSSSCATNLSDIMRHHDFVLSCIKYLNSTYSIFFLSQFFSSLFGICMSILLLISHRTSLFALQHVLVFVAMFTQLFFYCYAGAQVTEQSQKIARVVFHSSWWLDASTEVKRDLIMVMRRAQKNESISVGGMYDMDLELCSNVLKTALSFLNAVLALKK